MDRRTDERTDARTDRRTSNKTFQREQTGGRTDTRTDGQTHRRTDGHLSLSLSIYIYRIDCLYIFYLHILHVDKDYPKTLQTLRPSDPDSDTVPVKTNWLMPTQGSSYRQTLARNLSPRPFLHNWCCGKLACQAAKPRQCEGFCKERKPKEAYKIDAAGGGNIVQPCLACKYPTCKHCGYEHKAPGRAVQTNSPCWVEGVGYFCTKTECRQARVKAQQKPGP
jgi:hypothetical protein